MTAALSGAGPESSLAGGGTDGGRNPLREIEQAAVRLLADREHSRGELRRKLTAKGHSSESIERVLDTLEDRGWLSESRYVESYIAGRRRKGYGPLRIRAELLDRGVSPAAIDRQLDDSSADWVELMLAVARQRFGGEPAADRREQARRGRFLQQRGFSAEMIRRLLWDEGDV